MFRKTRAEEQESPYPSTVASAPPPILRHHSIHTDFQAEFLKWFGSSLATSQRGERKECSSPEAEPCL